MLKYRTPILWNLPALWVLHNAGNQSIEVEWRTYASVKHAIIGSDNDLSPAGNQATINTSDGLLSTGLLETNPSKFVMEMQAIHWRKWI